MELQPHELRIGNWVNFKTPECREFTPVEVYTIVQKEYPAYHPIPLTPEILEMAGFKEWEPSVSFGVSGYFPKKFAAIVEGVNSCGYDIKHGFVLGWFKEGWFYQNQNTKTKGRHIEYLHQLQNLYFALTATELEINLNKEK